MGVDIVNLIKVAEEITTDDQIGFAAEITYPVQELEIDGVKYELQLKLLTKPQQS